MIPPLLPDSTLLLFIAMHAEAESILKRLDLRPADSPDPSLSLRAWRGTINSRAIHLVTPGLDAREHVDLIGTIPAALSVHAAIKAFRPSLILNAGTAGGFSRFGHRIGDVCIGLGSISFHDRRVPLPGFDAVGRGRFTTPDASDLVARFNLKPARITTGDSLDMSETDAREINLGNHGELSVVKDMEAAAIALVAQLHDTPLLCIKSITDLCDIDHPTPDQFLANLRVATERLAERVEAVVRFLAGA
jgi:nucleoside phosphorylase